MSRLSEDETSKLIYIIKHGVMGQKANAVQRLKDDVYLAGDFLGARNLFYPDNYLDSDEEYEELMGQVSERFFKCLTNVFEMDELNFSFDAVNEVTLRLGLYLRLDTKYLGNLHKKQEIKKVFPEYAVVNLVNRLNRNLPIDTSFFAGVSGLDDVKGLYDVMFTIKTIESQTYDSSDGGLPKVLRSSIDVAKYLRMLEYSKNGVDVQEMYLAEGRSPEVVKALMATKKKWQDAVRLIEAAKTGNAEYLYSAVGDALRSAPKKKSEGSEEDAGVDYKELEFVQALRPYAEIMLLSRNMAKGNLHNYSKSEFGKDADNVFGSVEKYKYVVALRMMKHKIEEDSSNGRLVDNLMKNMDEIAAALEQKKKIGLITNFEEKMFQHVQKLYVNYLANELRV
ncbi:MAG: hypothetical protein ACP5N3_02575 [Candidatus Nanoarchaeia archaeon]